MPAPVVASVIAGRPFGVAVGVMWPGVGMLPALVAALASAGASERHRQALAAWSAELAHDALDAAPVAGGSVRSGVVYFPRAPGHDGGALTLRVVDLDRALRYTVRVPLPPA